MMTTTRRRATAARLARAFQRLPLLCGLLAGSLLLAACGGVGEEGTGIQPASASVGMVQGLSDNSVTVNGVSYAQSAATVTDGFGQPMAKEDLRLGMWLEVQGSVDDTGTRGVAQTIRVRPAARGVVTANGAGGLSLTVFDSTVHLDNGTVLDGTPDAASLAPGDLVEVHGPLSSVAGDVSASRVEKLHPTPQATPRYELRGRVSLLDTAPGHPSFTLGRRVIDYGGATLTLRQALANGQIVRVSAAAAPVAGTPWAVEKLTSDLALPDNLGFLYTEGFVESLQAGPNFELEGLAVDASSANGKGDIKAEGLRVAVVGALVNGKLKAKAVAVVQPGQPVVFSLSGPVTDFVSPASFRLRGVGIDASAATYLAPASPAVLGDVVRLRVKGTVLGRRLIASQVELMP
jgi:Domain of unknown function (DUF5666)